jgi:hypothetical protein
VIAEQMSPEFLQFDSAMTLVNRWAQRDFSGASAWVSLFPEGPLQDRAREELSKGLMTQPQSTEQN